MPRVDLARGESTVVERLVKAVRAVPRNLRDDLWTGAAAPLPPSGRPGWLVWQPVIVLLLLICAALLGVVSVNDLAFDWGHGLGTRYALLLGGAQSVALVIAAFRPLPAWWTVTVAMVVIAGLSGSRYPRDEVFPWTAPGIAAGLPGSQFPWDPLFPWTGPGIAAQAGVLFMLALRVRPRIAVEALTISLLAGLVCSTLILQGHLTGVARAAGILTAAVVVGGSLRGRQVARTELVVQEEMTAEERGRRTLLEERNRIARELHDVVAHHMSVISIQAQVAPHLVENPSDELKENLVGIRENAVGALTELRRVLGVLRSEDAVSQEVRHAPQPTLDQLDEMVGNVRGAGLTVLVRTTGEPQPLPPGVELSAFRIVQEALSNVMRHAPGADARVEIGYHATGLTVRVTNTAPDASAEPSQGAGHGLLGMRERTAMLGGEFANGPLPGGGYEVLATLPLEGSP
ncbi:sensor histidine kinase [Streptomyces sp. ISL-96]|uniref:sensor histidine kinase n=1 Tax=Streptomyces sp. ISL-96 TaxID=2819191 RepID=UPI001BE5CA95|nr:sensor histidine kinase [Streptomyces sp. ISL-96]MBT2493264.1 sensor histidine kinase [Streptomyces sp. ISL-96]